MLTNPDARPYPTMPKANPMLSLSAKIVNMPPRTKLAIAATRDNGPLPDPA